MEMTLPKGWKVIKLGDVCEKITDGSHRTPKLLDSGYPFLTVSNMQGEDFDYSNTKYISETDYKDLTKNDCKPLKGDVLFSKDGTVGKVLEVKKEKEVAVLSSIAILRPDRSILNSAYLAYVAKSKFMLYQTKNMQSGSALRRIILRTLKSVKIPLPPLPTQKKIVEILEEADSLRKLRQEADEKMKDLIPSLFVQMFGDPAKNPKGWGKVNIKDIARVKGGKRLPKGEAYSTIPTAFRYIRGTDIEPNKILSDQLVFLYPEVQNKIKRYIVSEGDVVITIAGKIGVVAPVSKEVAGANLTENAAKLVPLQEDIFNSTYLSCLLNLPFTQKQIEQLCGRVTIGKLALFRVEQIEVPLPPLPLQQKFAERVEEIKAEKARQAKSKKKLDDLFNSLMQRAFKGELVA